MIMPDIAIEFLNYMLTIKNISKKTVSEYYYDLRTFMRFIKVTKHNADENDFKELTVNDITLDDIEKILI
jgi:site-specific recombinase XerD